MGGWVGGMGWDDLTPVRSGRVYPLVYCLRLAAGLYKAPSRSTQAGRQAGRQRERRTHAPTIIQPQLGKRRGPLSKFTSARSPRDFIHSFIRQPLKNCFLCLVLSVVDLTKVLPHMRTHNKRFFAPLQPMASPSHVSVAGLI